MITPAWYISQLTLRKHLPCVSKIDDNPKQQEEDTRSTIAIAAGKNTSFTAVPHLKGSVKRYRNNDIPKGDSTR